jgi:hypothetical protein
MTNLMDSLASSALLILAGVALLWIGGTIIGRMRREATTTAVDARPTDPLAPFEAAYRRGQMSDEEYQRIREKLGAGAKLGRVGARPITPPPVPPPEPPPASPAEGDGSA